MTLTFIAARYIEAGRIQVTVIYTIVAFIDIYNRNKYVHKFFTNAFIQFIELLNTLYLPLQICGDGSMPCAEKFLDCIFPVFKFFSSFFLFFYKSLTPDARHTICKCGYKANAINFACSKSCFILSSKDKKISRYPLWGAFKCEKWYTAVIE